MSSCNPHTEFFKALRRQDVEEALSHISSKEHHSLKDILHWVIAKQNSREALFSLNNFSISETDIFMHFLQSFLKGILFNRLGRKDRSFDSFLEAEKIADNQNQAIWQIELYLERSSVLAWIGQYFSALDDLLVAVALASELNYDEALQSAWLKLGYLHRERCDYHKSAKFLQLAKSLNKNHLSTDERLKLDIDLAQNYCDMEEYDSATEIESSIGVIPSTHYNQFLHCLLKLRLSGMKADIKAIKHLEDEARERSDGSAWQEAILAYTLSCAIKVNSPQRALSLLKGAEIYFIEHHLTPHIWRCHILMVDIYLNLQQRDAAEITLVKAKQLAVEQHNRKLIELVDEIAEKHGLNSGLGVQDNITISNDFQAAKDGYAIIKEIGKGGFATVYKAFDMTRQCEVALKLFSLKEKTGSPTIYDLESSLKKELTVTAGLKHPAIVTPTGFGKQTEFRFYVTSQFIEGKSLRSFDAGNMVASEKIAMLFPIFSALAYAHQKHVIHKDIKPENILVNSEHKCFLIDFGNAALLDMDREQEDSGGTIQYLSPEVISKGKSGPEQDVYALALTCCEFVFGYHPFQDEKPSNIVSNKYQQLKLKSGLSELSIAPDWINMLVRALHFNPAKRPSSLEFMALINS